MPRTRARDANAVIRRSAPFTLAALLAATFVGLGAEVPVDAVDVRTFGAKGDGHADDSAALQRGLDSGKPLFFPSGTYLAENLTVSNQSAVTLTGPQAALKLKANDGDGAVTNTVSALAFRYYPHYGLKPGGEVVLAPSQTNHGVALMQEFRVSGMPLPQSDGRRFQCDYPVRQSLTYFVRSLKGWATVTGPAGISSIASLAITNGHYVVQTTEPHGLQVDDQVNLAGLAAPVALQSLSNRGRLGRATAPGHGLRDGQCVRIVSEEISGPRWGGWFDGLFIVTNATSGAFEFWMGGIPGRSPEGVVVAKPCRDLEIKEWSFISSNALKVITAQAHALVRGVPVLVQAPALPELGGVYEVSPLTSNAFRLNLSAPLVRKPAGALRVSVESAPAPVGTAPRSRVSGADSLPASGSDLNGLQRVRAVLDERRFVLAQAAMAEGITFVRWEAANLLTITDCRQVRIELGTIDGNYAASRSGRHALALVKVVVSGPDKVDSVQVRNTRFVESAGRCGHLAIMSQGAGGRLARGGARTIAIEDCQFQAWGNGGAILIYGPHGQVALRRLRMTNDGEAGWSEPIVEWFSNPAINLNGGDWRSPVGLGPIVVEGVDAEYSAGLCGGGYWFESLEMRNSSLRGWPTKADGYNGPAPQGCKWDDWGEGSPISIEACHFTQPSTNEAPQALKFAQSQYEGRQGPVRIHQTDVEGGFSTETSPAKPRVDISISESSFDLKGTAFGLGDESTIEVRGSRFANGRIDARGFSVFDDCGFRDCHVPIWGQGERGLVFNNCTFERSQPVGDTFVWYVANQRRARPLVLVGNRRLGSNPIRLRVGTGSPALISLTAIRNVLDLPSPGNTLFAPGVGALWRGNSFADRDTRVASHRVTETVEERLARYSDEGVATLRLAEGEALHPARTIQTVDNTKLEGPASVVLVQTGGVWREIARVPGSAH